MLERNSTIKIVESPIILKQFFFLLRRWITVERRARNCASSNYYPIPSDGELALAAVQLQCQQTTFHVMCI